MKSVVLPRPSRNPNGLRPALTLLWWEGAFFSVYDAWMGPVYMSGLAGELGVSIAVVALLTSVPWIGQIGQFLGLWAVNRTISFKGYTLKLAMASRAAWLVPLFLALFWMLGQRRTGTPFPVNTWFLILAGTACVSSLFSCSSGVAWMSWMKGIIPTRFQGRFLAGKQRYNMVMVILANLLAAGFVSWRPAGYRFGYAVLCVVGLLSASISIYLLSRVPDAPPQEPSAETPGFRPLWNSFLEPLRNKRFRRFLIFVMAFQGTIQLSGPYFPYYFTKELKISMSSVALWAMLNNLGALLAASLWGRRVDRSAGAPQVIWVVGHLIAASPLLYLSASPSVISWIGPFEYFVNGTAWVGYNVALVAMLFSIAPNGKNAAYFSVYSAAMGLSGAICVFLGGHIAQWLLPWGGFRALWVLSSVLRFSVLWTFGYFLLERKTGSRSVRLENLNGLNAEL